MDNGNINELKFWYYIDQGEVTGPFTEEEMFDLYQRHIIEDDTEVWKSGMLDWVELRSSDLSAKEDPKQMPEKHESNHAMPWILAFLPVLLAGAISRKSLPILIILLIIHCSIGVLDALFLIKEEKAKKTALVWALLLPPVYLYKRAGLMITRKLSAILWCLFFGIELFVCVKVYDIPALLPPQKMEEITEQEVFEDVGSITVNDFVKAYIRNPNYEIKEEEDGKALFNISGTMDYEGKMAEVGISFTVEADGSVHFKEIEINGKIEDSDIYHNMVNELRNKIG